MIDVIRDETLASASKEAQQSKLRKLYRQVEEILQQYVDQGSLEEEFISEGNFTDLCDKRTTLYLKDKDDPSKDVMLQSNIHGESKTSLRDYSKRPVPKLKDKWKPIKGEPERIYIAQWSWDEGKGNVDSYVVLEKKGRPLRPDTVSVAEAMSFPGFVNSSKPGEINIEGKKTPIDGIATVQSVVSRHQSGQLFKKGIKPPQAQQ